MTISVLEFFSLHVVKVIHSRKGTLMKRSIDPEALLIRHVPEISFGAYSVTPDTVLLEFVCNDCTKAAATHY